MDPLDPKSFNHRTELLSTGRKYHFVDQIPINYNHGVTPTLLCIHGFPDLWYGWRHQIGPWTMSGYRVIVPDMLGYGGTDKPTKTEEYSTKRLTDDLAALLDLLEITKAVVIGHDWGSFVAGRFALWHPERLLALVMLSVPYSPPASQYVPLDEMVKLVPNRGYQLYFADEISTKEVEANMHVFVPLLYGRPNGSVNFALQGELRKVLLGERKIDDLTSHCILGEKEIDYYVSQFTTMHGPLSYYRVGKIRYEEEKGIGHVKDSEESISSRGFVQISPAAKLPPTLCPDLPVLFIWGMADPTARASQYQHAAKFVAKLQDLALDGKGHWLMVESKDLITDKVALWLQELGLLPSPSVNVLRNELSL